MTWAPRNKSEDEDEDEGDAARSKEESPEKVQEGTETSAEDEGELGRGGREVLGNFLPRRGAVRGLVGCLPRETPNPGPESGGLTLLGPRIRPRDSSGHLGEVRVPFTRGCGWG